MRQIVWIVALTIFPSPHARERGTDTACEELVRRVSAGRCHDRRDSRLILGRKFLAPALRGFHRILTHRVITSRTGSGRALPHEATSLLAHRETGKLEDSAS